MTEKSSEREKFEPSERTTAGQKIEVFNGIEVISPGYTEPVG